MAVYVIDTELTHHGILGQKWGVRRYQNIDGTLTDLGKRRIYGTSEVESRRHVKNRAIEAARYQNDIDKYNDKIAKSDNAKRIDKFERRIKKLEVNRDIYAKNLSEEEIEAGKKYVDSVNTSVRVGDMVTIPLIALSGWGFMNGLTIGMVGGGVSAAVGSAIGSARTKDTWKEKERYKYEND